MNAGHPPDAEQSLEFVAIALHYLAAAGRKLVPEDLYTAIVQTFPDTGGALMETVAEVWIQQGIEQGVAQGFEQGVEQGVRATILEILEVRFGAFPATIRQALAAITDPARLQALPRQALLADSLDEFAEKLRAAPSNVPHTHILQF